MSCVEVAQSGGSGWWRTDDGQLVQTDQSIDVAEETGVIAAIGEIVLRDACTQVARWRQLSGVRVPPWPSS